MGHDHSHSHGLTGTAKHRKRLVAVLAITLAVVLIQIVGALISGSLALLADAGHMFTDVFALGLALFAIWLTQRPADTRRTCTRVERSSMAAMGNAANSVARAIDARMRAGSSGASEGRPRTVDSCADGSWGRAMPRAIS